MVVKQESWGGVGTPSAPKIFCCQDTGALFVVQPLGGLLARNGLIASLDGGATWTDPIYHRPSSTGSGILGMYGAAGGRLVCVQDSQYLASDGIGWA